ncbi:MAG: Cof-type HAD-IIB family hydrolase [Odoribacter sp.]|nr:Cof-type HAD-IIB family hydrolase [Odoribacter sp.]
MKTLYITDLDGTFLGDDALVSARSAATVTALSHAGALISVATARTPATVVPLMKDTYTTADMVVMTGAAMWNRPGGRFGEITLLSPGMAHAVMSGFEGSGVHPFCYTLTGDRMLDVYHAAPRLNRAEEMFVDLRKGLELKKFHLAQAAPQEALDRMALAFAMGPKDAIVAVADRLKETTDCYVSYYKDTYLPDSWLLEVFAAGVSKAAGVQRLSARLGVDRVVVFGDNLNDIPMMRVATVAVAVDNALDETKEAADVIIGPNTSDSVARYIQEDYEKNR